MCRRRRARCFFSSEPFRQGTARSASSRGCSRRRAFAPRGRTSGAVICFTRGTRLATPAGLIAVENLREGDLVHTRDGGPQEILWIGNRRLSGAQMHAMPELRPIRIRAGALTGGRPEPDLVVSPRHRVLFKGAAARALFGTPEVLVAAEDLANDRTITRDHTLREVDYIHLLLPRHHVVWANGVETESFHPASTDLRTVDPHQFDRLARIVPGVEAHPRGYGDPARRELTRGGIPGARGRDRPRPLTWRPPRV